MKAACFLVVLINLMVAAPTVLACGDKFLIVGRCVNYQRTHMAEHPGRVLILWSAASKSSSAIRDVELQEFLQQAGHRVHVVEETPDTPAKLTAGTYDVVVVDAADAERIRSHLAGTPTRVLPVMYRASRTELNRVRQTYRNALNVQRAPVRRNDLLLALDNTIRRKA